MVRRKKNKIVRRKNSTRKKPTKKKNSTLTLDRIIFIIVAIIFMGSIFYIFFCSPLTIVRTIDIRGTKHVDQNEIEQIVRDVLSENGTTCRQQDNYFFVHRNIIIKRILEDSRIKSVTVKKHFPQSIIINIVEYNRIAIVCSDDSKKTCFILENGYAKKPVVSNDDIVTQNKHFFIIEKDRKNISKGEYLFMPEMVEKIAILSKELVYVLDAKIVEPYVIIQRGAYEVQFNTDEGWYVLVDVSYDVDEILNTMQLFIKKVELPSRRHDLEYIDVRFLDKIFYKMNDDSERIEESVNKEK